MHAATRHVERWAPEAGANQVRSLRSLGFVDRMVAPWLEVAQRSASMRLFQQYRSEGLPERATSHVSWVFPRPWYQDELDWMAASREAAAQAAMTGQRGASMLTTRGTYVAPAQREQIALPAALYEHVAPALSIAPPTRGDLALPRIHDAYSPLVPFAAVNAAQLMQRAVAPLIGMRDGVASVSAMSPGLRSVLATMLERSVSQSSFVAGDVTRSAANAPELVTPPAPRAADLETAAPVQAAAQSASFAGGVVADVSAQRAQIVELQRAARVVTERQIAERTAVVAARHAEQQRVYEAQIAEQERASAQRSATAAAPSTPASTTAEQARIEERIAARLAERQQAVAEIAQQQAAIAQQNAIVQQHNAIVQTQRTREQRLHESAREAAARDAQLSPTPSAPPVAPQPAARVVPQEITNALSSLSPQLASVVASNLAAHPERAVQTINELGEALRNAELIAHAAAAGQTFEQMRGPRLVMPAGLGGLVATVDQNVAQTERRAQGLPFVAQEVRSQLPMAQTMVQSMMPMIAPRAIGADGTGTGRGIGVSAMRMPAIAWLAAPGSMAAREIGPSYAIGAIGATGSGTALGATESAQPQALQHVAWADRWLARFAGANPASLDLLTAVSAMPSTRLQALADAAPGTVFVAPQMDHSVDDSREAVARREAEAPVYLPPVRRYDDDEATPDDVLVAISQAASNVRAPSAPAAPIAADRESLADAITHTSPIAPMAGLSAQLASSPFAPAFRHMFPVATAPTFDVRALFGQALSATYLAGLLAPAAHEVATGAMIGQLPGFETIASTTPFAPIAATSAWRDAIEWSPAYVAPEAPATESSGVPADAALVQQYQQQVIEPLTTMRTALLSWNVESIVTPQATMPAMTQANAQQLQVVETMLAAAQAQATTQTTISAPTISAMQTFAPQTMAQLIGQSMVDAMSLPMAGAPLGAFAQPGTFATGDQQEGGELQHVPAFAAPGMIADRAQSWSVAQERSAADLSFDFVTPELVLAARVYGLGPAEAAQAMRLAIAGAGSLQTMASTVNRTFVQAMAIHAAREEAAHAMQTFGVPSFNAPSSSASGSSGSSGFVGGAPSLSPSSLAPFSAMSSTSAPITAYPTTPTTPTTPTMLPMVSTTFGVDRRTPRGAFMWPSATVAALGLSAAAPDGDQGMPVAALELLAAQSVAALGTYASLGFGFGALPFQDEAEAQTAWTRAAQAPSTSSLVAPSALSARELETQQAQQQAVAGSQPAEPTETDVMTSATQMVASSRRAKFEAMYLALGQSPQARSWSPTAKAARALALAGRGDETITALERAQIAWSVLPLVAPTMIGNALGYDADEPGAVRSTGVAAQREALRRRVELAPEQMYAVESRPGLSSLSSRAGEAIGSYVQADAPRPSQSSSSSGGSSSNHTPRETGAVLRAPTARPDYVSTGSGSVGGARSSGRFGGGEVEIPTWFESAARKMFETQSNVGGSADFSLAQLTLVQSAPATHIAASERAAPSSAPSTPNPSSQTTDQSHHHPHIDVEKVANEVYKHILVLMDGARARNGEPYL